MSIKNEIFDQRTTLFSVLDENEVTEIGALSIRVDRQQQSLDEYKLQLDGLAIRVDQMQARNEEQFLKIINDNTETKELVASNSARISANSNKIAELENQITDYSFLVKQVEDLEEKVKALEVITSRDVPELYRRTVVINERNYIGGLINTGTRVYLTWYDYAMASSFEYTGRYSITANNGYDVQMTGAWEGNRSLVFRFLNHEGKGIENGNQPIVTGAAYMVYIGGTGYRAIVWCAYASF